MRVGIALGSNLGDRHAHLQLAIDGLRLIHEEGDFITSSLLETEPVDCPPDTPLFLNAVIELETSINPLELLRKLQTLEILAGRPAIHDYHAPRTLDLDILYCDEMTLEHPFLQLPHPRITERIFVLQPLAEIRPDLILPSWNQSCREYLFKVRKKTP